MSRVTSVEHYHPSSLLAVNETLSTNSKRDSLPDYGAWRLLTFTIETFLATAAAHLMLVLHLHFIGSRSLGQEWLTAWRDGSWWVVFFVPEFALLHAVAFRFRPHCRKALCAGALVFYIFLATQTSGLTEWVWPAPNPR